MKNQYGFLFIMLLLTGQMAVGQDTGPVGRFGNGVQTDRKPFVGMGVAIPLYKLFSPKKAKPLPVWDKYRALELPDSALMPVVADVPVATDSVEKPADVQSVSSFGGGTINGDSLGHRTNEEEVPPAWTVTLPVVVITAPLPAESGGPTFTGGPGMGGPASIPNPGSGGGGDDGVTETDANGNPMNTPCREMRRRAWNALTDTKRLAGFTLGTALVGCGWATLKIAESTLVAGEWLILFPAVGEVTLAALVSGTALVGGGICVTTAALTFKSVVSNAESTYDMALLQIGPCP